jgi:pilus assembly protein CpaE
MDFPMSTRTQISDALSAGSLSIAVISPDEELRSAAVTALGECQYSQIQEFTSYPSNSDDALRMLGNDFDVVLIDMDSNPEYAVDLLDSICSTHGRATAMAYSAAPDPEIMLRCMRAGAREFLKIPFDRGVIAEALVRAASIRLSAAPEKKTGGRLLVFLSAKGGSGVTTLACNYAVSLAQESEKKTLLIDLNLPLGDAAINLGIRSSYSAVNALQSSGRLDSSFLATLLVQHNSGLYVLAAPSELATVQVSDDAIDKLLEVACQSFDYVVVDAGSRFELQHTRLFDESSMIYLVTQIGISELRNANRVISKLRGSGKPKFEIVINRCDSRSRDIDEEDITKALTKSAEWKIPNNYAMVRRMQSEAASIMQEDSPISRAIQEMTRSVCGKTDTPKKKKFSLFG